jgi:uncharacterized membrane protein
MAESFAQGDGLYGLIMGYGHRLNEAAEGMRLLGSALRAQLFSTLAASLPDQAQSEDHGERDTGHDLLTERDEADFDAAFRRAEEDGSTLTLFESYFAAHEDEFRDLETFVDQEAVARAHARDLEIADSMRMDTKALRRNDRHMARLFSIKPALTFRGRKFRGVRGWAGKPTHPPLTDFPIAAYVFAAVFDLISFFAWRSDNRALAREMFAAATFVLIGGALVGLLASITGFWDWWKGLDREKTGPIGKAKKTQVWRTINFHATVMIITTILVDVDIFTRIGQYDEHHTQLVVLILSCAAAALVALGANFGGSLVYDYQFNVEGLKGSTVYDETEVDQLPGDRLKPPQQA